LFSFTVQNYVQVIFRISQEEASGRATTGRLAKQLKVAPGTVTSMLKTLSERGLAIYTPYEGVRLAEAGFVLVHGIFRRQALLELFLAQVLGVDWQAIQSDAEHMGQIVSDPLAERIYDFLGRPAADIRGKPIPPPQQAPTGPG
jgi:DtxR family Mn-dependent transcriptional regulator